MMVRKMGRMENKNNNLNSKIYKKNNKLNHKNLH